MTLAIPHARSVSDAVPPVVGARLTVPLVDGRRVPYANLDHAASAPCLESFKHARGWTVFRPIGYRRRRRS